MRQVTADGRFLGTTDAFEENFEMVLGFFPHPNCEQVWHGQLGLMLADKRILSVVPTVILEEVL